MCGAVVEERSYPDGDDVYGTTVTGQRPALTRRIATEPTMRWAGLFGGADHHRVRRQLLRRAHQARVRVAAEGVELPAHLVDALEAFRRLADVGDETLCDLPGGVGHRRAQRGATAITGWTYTSASSAFCRLASPAA